jgi:hypothetical protein
MKPNLAVGLTHIAQTKTIAGPSLELPARANRSLEELKPSMKILLSSSLETKQPIMLQPFASSASLASK